MKKRMNPKQKAALGGLTAWAHNRERMLEAAERGREVFLARFKNDSEKRLYFKRLALKRGRRTTAEAPRPTLVLRPDSTGELFWQYWSGQRWVRVYDGMPPPALRELREHIGLPADTEVTNVRCSRDVVEISVVLARQAARQGQED